jgi:hypothetical protein
MTAHPILLKLVAEAVREAKAAGFTTDSDIASYMTNKKWDYDKINIAMWCYDRQRRLEQQPRICRLADGRHRSSGGSMTKLKIPAGFKVVTPPPGAVIIMLPARMINGKLDPGSVEEIKLAGGQERLDGDDQSSK